MSAAGGVDAQRAVADDAPDDTPESLVADAEARLRRSDVRGVESRLERALDDPTTDARLMARAATASAQLEMLWSRFDRALQWSQRAISAWTAGGDPDESAIARAIGARALLALGHPEDAVAEAMTALDDARRSGAPHALMTVTAALGHVQYGMQRYDQAQVYFERALAIAQTIGDPVVEGGMLDAIACARGSEAMNAKHDGDDAAARRLLTDAIALWEQAGRAARDGANRRNEVSALVNRAEALLLLDRGADALALLRSSPLDAARDLAHVRWHHHDTEGMVCLRLGRYDEAVALLTEALRDAEGNAEAMSSSERLSQAYEASGDPASALFHHKRFHALFRTIGSENAQRSARVAAIRLETADAQVQAQRERHRAERLEASNEQLSRRADDLAQLSLEDPLTGLANRRMMDKLIAADPHGYGVVMIDADHFKRINDGWSHAVGDEVLRRLARIMRSCCRTSDTPIRCGGEEFAVLVRHHETGAVTLAERIRHAIETYDWNTVAAGVRVTASVGVASAFEGVTTADVIALADARLYAAKDAGRNRVVGRDGLTT